MSSQELGVFAKGALRACDAAWCKQASSKSLAGNEHREPPYIWDHLQCNPQHVTPVPGCRQCSMVSEVSQSTVWLEGFFTDVWVYQLHTPTTLPPTAACPACSWPKLCQ